ncbi:Na+/H+ antiporter NhaC family protein, partial [Hornefia butyriciproducens]|uniref:Na+/H+ antiporter NhaC family protein n=1 Tax=Hornefia butyriciproducens TaxID=2652293 RepID=UPI003F8A2A5A
AYTQAQDKLADQIASYDADSFLAMDAGDFAALAKEQGLSTAIIGEYNIDKLIDGKGGMNSMMWTINLILCAMCFGGIMDASGMLGEIAQSLLHFAKGTGGLVTVTVISCVIMNVIAGDQYLSLVLPGRMYK